MLLHVCSCLHVFRSFARLSNEGKDTKQKILSAWMVRVDSTEKHNSLNQTRHHGCQLSTRLQRLKKLLMWCPVVEEVLRNLTLMQRNFCMKSWVLCIKPNMVELLCLSQLTSTSLSMLKCFTTFVVLISVCIIKIKITVITATHEYVAPNIMHEYTTAILQLKSAEAVLGMLGYRRVNIAKVKTSSF